MLSTIAVQKAKPAAKTFRLADERGLYLEVSPAGGKWWRFRYRFRGRENRLSLGTWPDVSLKDARDRRDEARRLLAKGIDPGENRKATKSAQSDRDANSFEVVAREWFEKYKPGWAVSHSSRLLRLFERDLFPWLGARPVAEIAATELLTTLRRIETRGAVDTSHRARNATSQVFRFAIATGRAERDPSADLRGAIPPARTNHFASATEPEELRQILRCIWGYEGYLVVRCALKLQALTFVRPGELRHAEWKDIDLEAGEWRYLVSKTKTPHIVPLSRQAVEILRELKPFSGGGRYVFPSSRSAARAMSDNAVLAALRRMGIPREEMTGHGFRAAARTILDEVLHVRPEFIEHQLAHAVKDPNGRAYNRTAHLPERREMMQRWADYLDRLKADAEVIPIRGGAGA